MDPITAIGLITIALVGGIMSLAFGIILYAVWLRSMRRVSDYFYDEEDVRRMRLAAVASALREGKPHKIPAVWREAKELVNDDD